MVPISHAIISDAETILALQKLAYASEAQLNNNWQIPPLTQTLASLQAEFADHLILKAVADGHIIGSVRAKVSGEGCAIGRLIVHPDHQGQGIGSALLREIEQQHATVRRYRLFTGSKSLANIRLYERHGYRITHTETLAPDLSLTYMEKPNLAYWHSAYREALSALADPDKAKPMAAYLRDQFAFYGIPTPARRSGTRPLQKLACQTLDEAQLLKLVQALWEAPQREFQQAGIDLLIAAQAKLSPAALPVLEALVVQKSWWDTVDMLATRVIGDLVWRHPELIARMDALVTHENLWLRRTAILYQLHWKDKTDEGRLLGNALRNADDPDFFIRKAIGWALRQYARTAPDKVSAWLAAYRQTFSPLTIREAQKHLSA